MGIYKNLQTDFIQRTLMLISQYEASMHKYDPSERFNHTLLINCLLGLIVFPKERIVDKLPQYDIRHPDHKKEMGLLVTTINPDIKGLRELIIAMRHSIAHFDIDFTEENKSGEIDWIVFADEVKEKNYVVATFASNELLPFVRYFANWLLHNIGNG